VPNRSTQPTTNARARPSKKSTSVQRKCRQLNSNNNESTSSKITHIFFLFFYSFLDLDAPPRSSSANNNTSHTFRPPLRLAPASPLFRNRLK
jgi:hypothetical protein